MANPLRGETQFEVEGRSYRLKFDWNAAAVYEDASGRPVSDVLLDISREKLSAKSLRAMLWSGLQEHHAEVTLKEAGHLIGRMGRREAQRVMGVALRYFFPELGSEEGGAAPAAGPPASPGNPGPAT